MRNLTIILVTLCLVYACNTNSSTNEEEKVEVKAINTFDGKHCFLSTVEGEPIVIDGKEVQKMIDSTILSLTIENNNVTGIYDFLPAERDSRRGNLKGTIDSEGVIKGTYSYSQEGYDESQEIFIQIKDREAIITDKMANPTLLEVDCK